jgi:hypothetical protein
MEGTCSGVVSNSESNLTFAFSNSSMTLLWSTDENGEFSSGNSFQFAQSEMKNKGVIIVGGENYFAGSAVGFSTKIHNKASAESDLYFAKFDPQSSQTYACVNGADLTIDSI